MKEIIPLKKDILFKTKVSEITNINLEHDYKIKDDLVSGSVTISGTYKIMEGSVEEIEFFHTIPFGIALSNKIDKNTIKIDVNDFNYEIVKDTLKVSILLSLTCDEIIEEEITPEILEIPQLEETIIEEDIPSESINNITNIISNENKYYTYKIYIVRKGDTIEEICNKYNVNKNILSEYNDLNDLNVGTKLLIPCLDESI